VSSFLFRADHGLSHVVAGRRLALLLTKGPEAHLITPCELEKLLVDLFQNGFLAMLNNDVQPSAEKADCRPLLEWAPFMSDGENLFYSSTRNQLRIPHSVRNDT
jgi:hypothetical protein